MYLPIPTPVLVAALFGLFVYGLSRHGLRSISNWLVLVVAGAWCYELAHVTIPGEDRSIWSMCLIVGTCVLLMPWFLVDIDKDME